MEPRQLRLPGFTRLWALERGRVRLGQRQSASTGLGSGYLFPLAQLNSSTRSSLSTSPTFQRLAPCGEDCSAFGTEQEPVVVRGVLDRLENRIFRNRDRRPTAFAHRAEDEEVADGFRHAYSRRDRGGDFPIARRTPRLARTPAPLGRSPRPGRHTCAAVSNRSAQPLPVRRTPSTCRSGRFRRPSDRRSRRAASQPSCSTSSNPITFLPSRRYGSFKVEQSNHSPCAAPLPTRAPHSSIWPSAT